MGLQLSGFSVLGRNVCPDVAGSFGDFVMSPQVEAIWQQIERLDDADRLILAQRLHELVEAKWKREVESARVAAGERGIDQQTIDDAVEELR
jgi:hypothetical protein